MSTPDIHRSLDEIIAAKDGSKGSNRGSDTRAGKTVATTRGKRSGALRNKSKSGSGGVSKTGAGAKLLKKSANNQRNSSKTNKSAGNALAAAAGVAQLAKRVVLSNMPRDIDEKQVRDFFSSRVGGISSIEGSYNAAGKPTGTFTITFRKEGHALQMMEKFNGTPVDGAGTPSLADRLGSTKGSKSRKAATKVTSADKKPAKKTEAPKKAAEDKKAKRGSRGPKRGPAAKRTAKSAEELDAEMSDYFAAAERSEISV